MRIKTFLLFLALSPMAQSALPDCMTRVANTLISKDKRSEFCKCWTENLSVLNSDQQDVLNKWADKKMTFDEFHNTHPTLAEFVFKVEESCYENPKFRMEKPDIEPTEAEKKKMKTEKQTLRKPEKPKAAKPTEEKK